MLERIQAQAAARQIRFTAHAQQIMVTRAITVAELFDTIAAAVILEDYPAEPRGACCLLGGHTAQRRPLHVVCTTARPELVIITVYEPTPPQWETPTQRRRS